MELCELDEAGRPSALRARLGRFHCGVTVRFDPAEHLANRSGGFLAVLNYLRRNQVGAISPVGERLAITRDARKVDVVVVLSASRFDFANGFGDPPDQPLSGNGLGRPENVNVPPPISELSTPPRTTQHNSHSVWRPHLESREDVRALGCGA